MAPPHLPNRFGGTPSKARLKLRTTLSLLGYVFPLTRQRARSTFLNFRYETLPFWKQRAHLRLYRALIGGQKRNLKQSYLSGKRGTLFPFLLKHQKGRRGTTVGTPNTRSGTSGTGSTITPRRSVSGRLSLAAVRQKDADIVRMATRAGPAGSFPGDDGTQEGPNGWKQDWAEPGRERGARRKKVYGYLKAANELRQAYSAQWAQKAQELDGDLRGIPGGFPEVEASRSADEEMVLFPSYARRHSRKPPEIDHRQHEWGRDNDHEPDASEELEYWKRQWEIYEDDHAVVDVDVRGWLYIPHRGPMNRKNRILVALARRMSGIPPPTTGYSDTTGPGRQQGFRERLDTQQENQEEALVEKQAKSLVEKGQTESDAEWRLQQSGRPESRILRSDTQSSADYGNAQDSIMSHDEILAANAQLMERLRPFLNNPMTGIPISVFFFNESQSQSRTVTTNDGGQFSLRAALDFVPTHIRVLASENLSATEEVKIIEPRGISVISDIDDTIKHSAIASGTKEIFRNTFVRSLEDLKVLGVNAWYNKMTSMGVRMHYVSNSPWQLYPLLRKFFELAGLPPGSIHLKQYSGMLQGIFEPTTEKKRPILEKILLDFPERRFILVGDSGEADLEIYTDLALANPGRVIGIFIRDVTTLDQSGFFDTSAAHLERPATKHTDRNIHWDSSDALQNRPVLPPRASHNQRCENNKTVADTTIGDLIDLDEDDGNEATPKSQPETPKKNSNARPLPPPPPQPPSRPSKPPALRSISESATASNNDSKLDYSSSTIRRKPAPPLPQKPHQLSVTKSQSLQQLASDSDRSSNKLQNANTEPPPEQNTTAPSARGRTVPATESYTTAVRNKVTGIYNQLPSARAYLESTSSFNPLSNDTISTFRSKQPPPPPPPRRTAGQTTPKIQSGNAATDTTPQTLPRPATSSDVLLGSQSRVPTTKTTTTSSPYSSTSSISPQPTIPNRREEMWKRRWARAKDLLDSQGVILSSWRVGDDVQDTCVRIIQNAEKEMQINDR